MGGAVDTDVLRSSEPVAGWADAETDDVLVTCAGRGREWASSSLSLSLDSSTCCLRLPREAGGKGFRSKSGSGRLACSMSAGAGCKGICALWIGCLVIEVSDALLRKGIRLSRVVSNVRKATAGFLDDSRDSCGCRG